MKRIALHPALQGLPFILETPNEDEGYIEEIKLMRSWSEDGEISEIKGKDRPLRRGIE